ncbi:hypothetical protein AB2M62_13280 [Sphingomonas sp. MMS12-HWE2-04]|uniref:hypothetical protein n=1 Tax=Sphingomonas sp. MMS12-HWE2-04 TaxID=3234199 RepID=UPI00384C69D3
MALLLPAFAALPVKAADPVPFDLAGPGLVITVTRGETTLPIGQVPSLAPGDKLNIAADLPKDQRARFLLVSAFLNGATNPPPKQWIHVAETWKPKAKDNRLALTIPDGARQMILFLVPDTGGAEGTIEGAVRGKPGEFVRATQALNQASLDRSRLNAFIGAIQAQENTHPEHLKTIAPTLAGSLAMKLNADCLAKVVEFQAACLLENRDSLVLADVHSSTMAETLIGAPTDLALQLSYTREGGLGYYSPYIAVVRDLARVFGAFSNPQFNYLPTLSQRQDDRVSLLLNTAPSFAKPKSVLVVSMPSIAADAPPRLRDSGSQPLCGAQPGMVLPVEGAPLVFSTGYAHDMMVRLIPPSGTPVERPVTARADRAGYLFTDGTPLAGLSGTVKARLHGQWGFAPFDGPEFALQFPDGQAWRADKDANLVIGRDNDITLAGPAPACVRSVTMRIGDAAPQRVAWKAGDDTLALTLPLKDARPGEITIAIEQYGATAPASVRIAAYRQASKLDALDIHGGDMRGVLSGQRLDQVASVELGGVRLNPDGLTRDGDIDRLKLLAEGDGRAPDKGAITARVKLTDGRTLNLPVTIAAARPHVALLGKTLAPEQTAGWFEGFGPTLLPDIATLDFSVRAGGETRFLPNDVIEVATDDEQARTRLTAGPALRLEGPSVLVASFDPAALGPSVSGPLKFRLVRGSIASDWQPLAVLARLPRIDAVACNATTCTLQGGGLYLIDAVLPTKGGDDAVQVPSGFTARTLSVPAPADGELRLRLRDAPDAHVTLSVR